MFFRLSGVPILFFLLSTFLFHFGISSFCGKSGVPYSLEVLPSGAPVLGCAQPSCVISAVDGEGEFQEDSQFLTDASGQSDGFFRDGDRALKRFRHSSAPKLIANCSGQFNELSCPRRNQWVGGIEYIDHPRQPLILQCCTFEGLRFSQEVGSTTIGPGEAITGGEVVRGGRQISFDVIANVKKVVKQENNSGNKITYEVTVRRMNCLPDPPEPEIELDSNVPAEVAKVLSNAKNKELTDKFKDPAKKPQPNKKQRAEKQKHKLAIKQQAAPTEELPEISGGEGDRPPPKLPPPKQQQQQIQQQQLQPQQARNSEAAIQPTFQQNLPQNQQQQQAVQFIPQEHSATGEQFIQQRQFVPDQQPQQQQGGGGGGGQAAQEQQFFPTLIQPQDFQQQQQLQQPQQQQQQQPTQFSDQLVTVAASSPTSHPLFGLMSFPTLPPHSFPTLPPHSFPTLPPHTFPTIPPHHHHSFPTLPPHTFPGFPSLFGTTPAPLIGSGTAGQSAAAFAAPSVPAPGGSPIPLSGSQPSASPGFQPQQQINTPHSAYRREHNALPTGHHVPPKMAPAMGTILAAMQGERYPVMDPIMGLIGYSNSQPAGMAGSAGKKK